MHLHRKWQSPVLESRRCLNCQTWHHYWMSTGRTRQDDTGHPHSYQTKAAAERARREFEKGSSGFAPARGDRYAGRKRK